MTDIEIRDALINRDDRVTYEFFFERCRPLFTSVIRRVFSYDVDYDECINELYIYLLEDDARRLRQYEGRSTIFQWLKIVSIHFFIAKRNRMIEDRSQEPPLYKVDRLNSHDEQTSNEARMDVETLLGEMSNERYATVIRRLIIEDATPEDVAQEMGVTIDNLYNIKKRAIKALTLIAIGIRM